MSALSVTVEPATCAHGGVHRHGTRAMAISDACPCGPCLAAKRDYQAKWRKKAADRREAGIEAAEPVVVLPRIEIIGSQDWMDEGVCAQVDPEIFFPEKGSSPEPAKSICRVCPVVEKCLQYALDNSERGVWGATTGRERAAILRARGQ